MKQSLIIIVFAALCHFSCDKDDISSSQAENFIKYYTNFPEFSAADVVTIAPSGYALLGTAKTAEDSTRICLLRTDEYGNSINDPKLYGPSPINRAYCLKALSDGYAILGSTLDPETDKYGIYFIRTDNNGDTLWTRTIKKSGNIEAKYFDVNNEESFFLTGYCDSVGNGKQIWWFAIDKDGKDIRNQRTHGFQADDEGTHLQILPDGRLVITGYITRSNVSRAFIIKTHETTIPADIYELPVDNGVGESGNCIRALDSDNFIVLGTRKSTSLSETSLKKVVMSPSVHSIQWAKTFSNPTQDLSKGMIMDGNAIYILGTTLRTGSSSSITLIRSDLSGNQVSRSEFGQGSLLSASSFKRTSDNGFIIAGTNGHPEANNTSLTLVKTDAGISF